MAGTTPGINTVSFVGVMARYGATIADFLSQSLEFSLTELPFLPPGQVLARVTLGGWSINHLETCLTLADALVLGRSKWPQAVA